jgi:putative heme-binding domain-containing protein
VENILDPNAVVGADFEATDFALADGDTVSGLVVSETAEAITLRTVVEQRTLVKKDIRRRERSGRSLMPEGLLESLAPRERLELLKFLSEN